MSLDEGERHDTDMTGKEVERYAELSIVSFPHRLWAIVGKYQDGLIRWGVDGTKIIIDEKSFENEILDKYTGLLRSNKLRTFKRRLNAYGFRTVVSRLDYPSTDKSQKGKMKVQCEFSHPNFQRGKPHLLKHVICQDLSYKRKLALLRLKRKNRDMDLRCPKCACRFNSESSNDGAVEQTELEAATRDPAQASSSKSEAALNAPTSTAEVSNAKERDAERDDRIVMLPYILSGRGYVPLVPSRRRLDGDVSATTRCRERACTANHTDNLPSCDHGRVASALPPHCGFTAQHRGFTCGVVASQKPQECGGSHSTGCQNCLSSESRSIRHSHSLADQRAMLAVVSSVTRRPSA